MSVRTIPLFDTGGYPTPFLMAQWRQKGGRQALQTRAQLVDGGSPTAIFTAFWRAAFPTRDDLPNVVADAEGRGTDAFWTVFR